MKIQHTDTQLIIRFEGLQCLWSFRKKIVIPKESIGQVYWERYFTGWAPVFTHGSCKTMFLYAGSFKIHGTWEYWYLKHPGVLGIKAPNTMTIELLPDTSMYRFIRITASEEQANELADWCNVRR